MGDHLTAATIVRPARNRPVRRSRSTFARRAFSSRYVSPSERSEEAETIEQRGDNIVEDVVRTHGDPTGRHRRPFPNALRRMGQEALIGYGARPKPSPGT